MSEELDRYGSPRTIDGVVADARHISVHEARDAASGEVGSGTPETAPVVELLDEEAVKTWWPTQKWWALVTSGLASIVGSWIVTGAFDDVERGMVATLVIGAVAAYWKRNDDTPGGVPVTYEAAREAIEEGT